MKRLSQTEGSGPVLDEARRLLDAVEPLAESEARMERVRRELDRPQRAGVGVPGLGRVPALAFTLAVALFGASAFAAVRFVASRADAPAEAPSDAQPAAEPPLPRAVGAAPPPDPAPAEGEPAPPELDDDQEPGPVAREAPPDDTATGAVKPTPRRTKRAPTAAEPEADEDEAAPAPAGHDSQLVHRAVQALRRDGNPGLAARLLDEHARRYPSGPLAEEALSLRVEAATALRDPRAVTFAREYLRRYPGGRYAAIARAALAKSAP